MTNPEYTIVNFINGSLWNSVMGSVCLEGTLDNYQCAAKLQELGIQMPTGATAFLFANVRDQDPNVCNTAYLAVLERHKNRLLSIGDCEIFEAQLKATVPPELWKGVL